MGSKLDYLQKYMSDGGKKKRRKKRKNVGGMLDVVDADGDWRGHAKFTSVEDELLGEDEKPVIVDGAQAHGDMAVTPAASSTSGAPVGAWTSVEDVQDAASPSRESSRRRARHDSDGSVSDGASDASPPRRTRHDSDAEDSDEDLSPPRREDDSGSDSDASPPRRAAESDSDASPPRRTNEQGEKLASGASAGLHTGASFRKEMDRVRAREEAKLSANAKKMGKGAETVYRDREGRKGDPQAEVNEYRQQLEDMKKSKGPAYRADQDEAHQYAAKEAQRPLARYADDADLNKELADEDRWGDPMAEFFEKKSAKRDEKRRKKEQRKQEKDERRRKREERRRQKLGLPPLEDDAPPPDAPAPLASSASSSAVLAPSAPPPGTTFPKYKGAWPPNRYGIPPGHRWDGVDRSNGFEQQLLATKAAKAANEEQQYKFSVADM